MLNPFILTTVLICIMLLNWILSETILYCKKPFYLFSFRFCYFCTTNKYLTKQPIRNDLKLPTLIITNNLKQFLFLSAMYNERLKTTKYTENRNVTLGFCQPFPKFQFLFSHAIFFMMTLPIRLYQQFIRVQYTQDTHIDHTIS